jgi:Lipoprotein confined to pathogenic Mycobacterium
MMTVRVAVWSMWMVVVFMSVFGCGATDPGTQGNPGPQRVTELENGLRAKPSLEEAKAEYSAAMNQMAGNIAALTSGMTWHVKEDSWRGCGGDYGWTRAKQVYYYIVFDKAIPDDLWPHAIEIVKNGAAHFGATTVNVFVDQPGNKDLTISGAGGVEFEFGTAKQTIFSGKSDCRMSEADTSTPTTTR